MLGFTIGLITGLVAGGIFGIAAMCIVVAGKRGEM